LINIGLNGSWATQKTQEPLRFRPACALAARLAGTFAVAGRDKPGFEFDLVDDKRDAARMNTASARASIGDCASHSLRRGVDRGRNLMLAPPVAIIPLTGVCPC